MLKAPFPWLGGKQKLLELLLAVMPPHDNYCEPFGGAGALLFAKPKAKLEVYNDIDSGLVNVFRVLRDPKWAKRLQELLNLTPYAREEYLDCRATWMSAPDEVEMARRWLVVALMSFGGKFGHGWGYTIRYDHDAKSPCQATKFRSHTQLLPEFGHRLAHVQVEHGDYAKVITTYDDPRTLFYCDPPYLAETRKAGGYAHEMSDADHVRMLEMLCSIRGMVMLSGYDSPLYAEALQGWRRVDKLTSAHVAGRTRKSNLQGKGAAKERQSRTECIWLSPNAVAHQPTLFAEGVAS